MGKELTEDDRQLAADMLARARAAMAEIEDWDQDRLDRLSQAIAWYAGNEKNLHALWLNRAWMKAVSEIAKGAPRSASRYIWCCAMSCAHHRPVLSRSMRKKGWCKICQARRRDRIPDPHDQSGDDTTGDRRFRR